MRKFKDEEITLMINMCNDGCSFAEIGRELKRDGQVIGRKLKRLGYVKEQQKGECIYCQKTFEVSPLNSEKQRYCSSKCRVYHYYEKNPDKKPKRKTYTKQCDYCNEEFETTSKINSFCTKEHRNKYKEKEKNKNRTIKLYVYNCENCSKRGLSKRKRNYCSEQCYENHRNKKKRNIESKLKRCAYCNKWHRKKRKFCSKKCRNKYGKVSGWQKHNKRMIAARKNGQFDADIDIYKLIERDGGQCYLCGDVVLFELHYNDAKYPTIEHVIPIAKGGTHSWDNVKVACRDCNSRKSTMTDEEYLKRRTMVNGEQKVVISTKE